MTGRTERVHLAGSVDGWRAWHLYARGTQLSLAPIGRGRWWPHLRPAIAACWRVRRHRAPIEGCTCGLYAVADAAPLDAARSPAVIGTVALWGTVIEHAIGYRAEFAYPQRLTLVCHVCAFQRGVGRARPDIVAAFRGGSLVPLCDHHRRVREECDPTSFDVVPAREVLGALTSSYAVEQLPPAAADRSPEEER
jgi:hypothetical protein